MAKKNIKDVDIIEEDDSSLNKVKGKKNKKEQKEETKIVEEKVAEKETTNENIPEELPDTPIVENKEEPIKEEVKKEKKRRFWDEVKSFFILLIIIGLVILGGWLFIEYARPIEWNHKKDKPEDEVKVNESKDYNISSYTTTSENGSLEVINNKYLIEYNDNYVTKIMDLQLNVLYEATENEEYDFFEGTDGKLYGVTTGDAEDSLILNLYVLEKEKIVEIKEFSKMGVYYVPLYTDDYLVGIVGNNCYLNDELNETCETEVFTLDEKNDVLDNLMVVGDLLIGSDKSSPIYTRNSKFVVVKNILENKYGLYDLVNHELIIKSSYDDLYTTYNNSYVAIKDNKAGIIDKKLKKLVDFEYDFIDIQNDYYVVGKNDKLAIMDKDYKLVTGFDFPYIKNNDNTVTTNFDFYTRTSLLNTNSFATVKLEDKYLLINNVKNQSGYTYLADSVFVINGKDNHKKIDVEAFGIENLLYSYSVKNGKLVVYDENLAEEIVLDLSDYDYSKYPTVELVNGNTIVVTMDSELYFDYETGEEVTEIQDATFKVLDLELKYTNKEGKVLVLNGEKEIASYPYNPLSLDKPYIMIDDNSFYYLENGNYVFVQKR